MRKKRSPFASWITSCALLISLCAGATDRNAKAQSDHKTKVQASDGARGKKVSTDLRDLVSGARYGNENVRVILQTKGEPGANLQALLRREGVKVHANFRNFNTHVLELPAGMVDELAADGDVTYVSPDRDVKTLGHVSLTTGTDAVRTQTTPGGKNYTLDGSGIGIAVLDSGMYTTHQAFLASDGRSRVAVSVDFTGAKKFDLTDKFGHATHVAGLAAGSGDIYSGGYTGIAPNAKLINLAVLNSQGIGQTSWVLNALDWVMANKATYNIRVVNMSLGTLAVDSYRNDPLCKAVRRLVDAGVVVVVAAGNLGSFNGQKYYGLIESPGNEPSAITVGASNTFGTDSRSDDVITTYSSRGPTRSWWTDSAGVAHYDNLIKPDLVAPGNKLVSAEGNDNWFVTNYPYLNVYKSGKDEVKMMYLSGTSMATPVVSGAAALLLQANPRLTPNMVKMILEYTAQPLRGYNQLEQGAGEVNVEGAVRLARLVRTDLSSSTPPGEPLLTTATLPEPYSTINGYTFTWSQGLIVDRTYATGTELISLYQKVYDSGVLVSHGVLFSNGVLVSHGVLVSNGILMSDSVMN